MINPLPPFRGKTLPVDFTYGLMQAHLELFLQDIVLGILGVSFQDLFSTVADVPLYAYVTQANYSSNNIEFYHNFKPVDYWYLEQMRKGFIEYYGPHSAPRAQLIGSVWWASRRTVLSRGGGLYDLQYLIGFDIVQSLRQVFHMKHPDYYSLNPLGRKNLIQVACQTFSDKLQSESGLACRITEHHTGFLITFPDCPFCANKLPTCNILFGVVQGLLLWLLGIRPNVKSDEIEEN